MGEHFTAAADAELFAGQDEVGVEEHWVEQVVVVAVSGTVDTLTAPKLTEAIGVAAAKSPAGVIIDLSKVEFLASAGMSALIAAHTDVTPNARFGVVADGPATSRPLTLLGVDSVIAVYGTLDEALHDISGA
jgi:anti-sigma B factor antagonist